MIEMEDFIPDSEAANQAVEILRAEILTDESHDHVRNVLGQLTVHVFLDDDTEKVVAVSGINTLEQDRGDILLEYLAVAGEEQGKGFGREAIQLLIEKARDLTDFDDGVLKGVALADELSFYLKLGAKFDDSEGTFYFPLGETISEDLYSEDEDEDDFFNDDEDDFFAVEKISYFKYDFDD